MINNVKYKGEFEIRSNKILIDKFNNRVMDAVLNYLVNNFLGTSTNLEIKYLAIGTSATAVTGLETQLGNEVFRTPKISLFNDSTGVVKSDYVILDSDYVGSIQEIGIFAGAAATATANTGILVSRVLWAYSKTGTEELNITRTERIVL